MSREGGPRGGGLKEEGQQGGGPRGGGLKEGGLTRYYSVEY
eukprot:CAMPEP_0174720142 /NCGR_PEP_ID=MMETSP1094-20130205/32895_1 /TAXON_ID=156173 /ORGANISM="Chrysochromulina brevifilum, Strain UTEX LB 985" /LENGTH=40 /DNA_ID= /DNA_START= /DNA_END= /DNA_ORIENTATION=